MKALLSQAAGGPETLVLADRPVPAAGPGELLVKILVCAINYPDVLIIEDKYQFKPERPFAPGSEICAEVAAVGEDVEGWAPGDRLIAVTGHGGLSEYMLLPAAKAFALPHGRDPMEGAALLMTYATTIHALVDRGALAAGETLLVLGAACAFSSDDTAATTRAPIALPISTAARPTPPAAPSTSNVSPAASAPRSTSAWMVVA